MKPDEMMTANAAFAIVGALLGYASYALSKSYGIHEANFLILLIAIFATKVVLEKTLKISQPWKWWLTNGALICILMWLVVWTVLFNLGL